MSLANVESFKGAPTQGAVLKRMETLATDVATLRERLRNLQIRIDGGPSPSDPQPNELISGLKGNLDRIENDIRAITRTMSALEELL